MYTRKQHQKSDTQRARSVEWGYWPQSSLVLPWTLVLLNEVYTRDFKILSPKSREKTRRLKHLQQATGRASDDTILA